MKWHNRDREDRRNNWYAIPVPSWYPSEIVKIHRWCTNLPGDGKFYHHFTNTRWWFEDERDAMLFTLFWVK